MDNIQGGLVIVGIVNGVRLLQEAQISKDYWGFILFVIALLTGILLGLLHLFGLDLQTGILVALGSSGLYRISEKVGSQ